MVTGGHRKLDQGLRLGFWQRRVHAQKVAHRDPLAGWLLRKQIKGTHDGAGLVGGDGEMGTWRGTRRQGAGATGVGKTGAAWPIFGTVGQGREVFRVAGSRKQAEAERLSEGLSSPGLGQRHHRRGLTSGSVVSALSWEP